MSGRQKLPVRTPRVARLLASSRTLCDLGPLAGPYDETTPKEPLGSTPRHYTFRCPYRTPRDRLAPGQPQPGYVLDMENFGNPDWWWHVGLSGLGGTLLAAGLAVAGVWATLRHDRKLAWEASFSSHCREELKATRRLRWSILMKDPEAIGGSMDWSTDIAHLAQRVAAHEPCLHAVLMAGRDKAMGEFGGSYSPEKGLELSGSTQTQIQALQSVEGMLERRLLDAKHFSRMRKSECDSLVKQINEGWVVT